MHAHPITAVLLFALPLLDPVAALALDTPSDIKLELLSQHTLPSGSAARYHASRPDGATDLLMHHRIAVQGRANPARCLDLLGRLLGAHGAKLTPIGPHDDFPLSFAIEEKDELSVGIVWEEPDSGLHVLHVVPGTESHRTPATLEACLLHWQTTLAALAKP